MSCRPKFQLLTGITGSTDFALDSRQFFRCFGPVLDIIRKTLVDVTRKILQILKMLEVLIIYNTC